MKEKMKQKYVPCQLDVVEFNVERGFATSGMSRDMETNAMLWKMADDNSTNRNESYGYLDWTQTWADEHGI